MKLIDLENESLHQKAFTKDQQKAAKKRLTTGQVDHMTAPEMIDLLAKLYVIIKGENLLKEEGFSSG